MKRFFGVLFVLMLAVQANASIFVNGAKTTRTLEAIRTAGDVAGKTVTIDSALTQAQSNITAAWPTDRALKVEKGGSIANSTAFTINGPFSAGDYQVFAGAGAVTGLDMVKPEWFGELKTGVDDTAAVHRAIAALGSDGTLEFSSGTHTFNLDIDSKLINIKGQGGQKTILTSYTSTGAAITIGGTQGWQPITISDLAIKGGDGTYTKQGIQLGHTVYQSDDEVAGRVVIRNVLFKWLDKCVIRLYGNIGLYAYNSNFSSADFHIWSMGQTSPLMHAGNLVVRDCHFEGGRLASTYMDSPQVGTGQVMFDSCVIELNPGFVFFIKNFYDVSLGEGFVVKNTWNEQTATAASVTIDGVAYTPRHLYAKNTAHVRFEDTTMGSVELINSNLSTNHCQLDVMTLTKDVSSSAFHDNAIYESGKNDVGLVNSLQNMTRLYGGNASVAYLSHRTATSKRYAGSVSMQDVFDAPATWTGTSSPTTTNVADGILEGQRVVQSLPFASGDIFLHPSGFTVSADRHYAWYFTYKYISGVAPTFTLEDAVGLMSNSITLNHPAWTTIGGVTNTFDSTGLPAASRVRLTGAGTGVIQMAGVAVMGFLTKHEALEFINSRVHPGEIPTYLSAAGVPTSTPVFINQEYLDTTSAKWYKAKATTSSADWLILN